MAVVRDSRGSRAEEASSGRCSHFLWYRRAKTAVSQHLHYRAAELNYETPHQVCLSQPTPSKTSNIKGVDLTLLASNSLLGHTRGCRHKWQSACSAPGQHAGTYRPARLCHPSWIIKGHHAYCTLALTSGQAVGLSPSDLVERRLTFAGDSS